jgi:hypothetical protein
MFPDSAKMTGMTRFSRLLLLLLGLYGTACTLIGIGVSSPAATATPLGDTLSFTMPAYAISLEPGESVPGTRLKYVGRQGDAYQVSIDGLSATKRTGDSFIWNGVLAPGVYANFNLRLTMAVFGPLAVAGPVTITVFNPQPVEQAMPVETAADLSFNNIVVNYSVPAGRVIPGTTLVYEGMVAQSETDQGNVQARLSGLSGYPFLALGDSLLWTGRLRDNIMIRYSLRVASISEQGLRLAGTAELHIIPVQ